MRRIDINLQVSSYFTRLLIAILTGSLILIFTLPVAPLTKLWLVCATLPYNLYILWRYGLYKGPRAISHFYLDQEGWHCLRGGQTLAVELSGHSTVTSLVSVIRFKLSNQKKMLSVVVFRDALPLTLYRQLIVEMRTHRAFKPSPDSLSL